MTEKQIESVQEYNLLKLLKANTDPSRWGIQLEHEFCRVITTDGWAMIVADLDPEQWDAIFGLYPHHVAIHKLTRDKVDYSYYDPVYKIAYGPIYDAIGEVPRYFPVMHFDLKFINNLTQNFDEVYLVKQSGQALFLELVGDKYPAGSYYGVVMPMVIDRVETDHIINGMKSVCTNKNSARKIYISDKRQDLMNTGVSAS